MKKSRITIFISLGLILAFFTVFQLSMRKHFHAAETQLNQKELQMEVRTLAPFDGIAVKDGIVVEFSQDEQQTLNVFATEQRLSSIVTRVVDRILIVEKTSRRTMKDSVVVAISNLSLNFLKVSNAAEFRAINEVKGSELNLDISSDGSVNINITYDKVHCKAASGSNVNITGNSNQIDFSNE
jgi:hypothetical protein